MLETRPVRLSKAAQDRVKGVLIGLAAGDCCGTITPMARLLGSSLLARKRFEPSHMLHCYLTGWRQGRVSPDPVGAMVLDAIASGIAPVRAVKLAHRRSDGRSASATTAQRAAPLAMLGSLRDDVLKREARRESRLTHHDPLAGDVAAAVVSLCRSLIQGVPWSLALETASRDSLLRTRAALMPSRTLHTLRRGSFAPDVLRAVIWCLSNHGDFTQALDAALAFDSKHEHAPILVGILAGARWGASTIPSQALAHVEGLHELNDLAHALAMTWDV